MASAGARILIVDEHPVIVSGLGRLIGSHPGWTLAAGVPTCDEAIALLERSRFDLVILEPAIGGLDGLGRISEIAARARVLCLSALDESLMAERALREGARGYLMKTYAPEEILAAIQAVLAGDIALSESVRRSVIGRFAGVESPKGPGTRMAALNNRELQVIHLLGANHTSRQIAHHMHVSEKTVATHRTRIREKLHLPSSRDLVRMASRWVELEVLS